MINKIINLILNKFSIPPPTNNNFLNNLMIQSRVHQTVTMSAYFAMDKQVQGKHILCSDSRIAMNKGVSPLDPWSPFLKKLKI